MASFKFNFFCEDGEITGKEPATQNIQWTEAKEILPDKQIIHSLDNIVKHAKMFISGEIEIGHAITKEAISKIEEITFQNAVKLAENADSDLVAGQYEGGLKIWECTADLVAYLEDKKELYELKNKKVLDLGCGAGILGIYAFMNGADVTFQDYNAEVLEYTTIPNVLLNIEEENREKEIKRCKFFSGDWASFNNKDHAVYDIILTSETIYNDCNYTKLATLFMEKLKEGGIAFVAAKTYYFGVGGGTRQFEKIINNNLLISKVCWKNTGGIQREILKITKKNKVL